MKHCLKPPEKLIDLNQVRYDLALAYAKEKLRFALEHDCVPDCCPEHKHPKYLDETEYLMNEFSVAMDEYGNRDDSDLLQSLDFTYGHDSE